MSYYFWFQYLKDYNLTHIFYPRGTARNLLYCGNYIDKLGKNHREDAMEFIKFIKATTIFKFYRVGPN